MRTGIVHHCRGRMTGATRIVACDGSSVGLVHSHVNSCLSFDPATGNIPIRDLPTPARKTTRN